MEGKLEIFALVLGIIGLIGTIAVTVMPMWKVTAFIGANLIVMETQWEGLWMACIWQIDINMQCKVYDSLLILPADIQSARGLMCASITLAVLAVLMSVVGINRTNCCQDDARAKNVILVVSGCLFVMASLATLLPVSWSTHTIVRNFYNPAVVNSQKREIGQALFLGFATFLFLVVAGVILLCWHTPCQGGTEDEYVSAEENKEGVSMLKRTPSDSYQKSQYI